MVAGQSKQKRVEAIVAGHICLDVIPTMFPQEDEFRYRPGTLVAAGPATISTGGCVPNTGVALHRLGADVRLMGKVGDDPFGKAVVDGLAREASSLADSLLVIPGEHTSYSVVLSPPEHDRMILHYSGANDTFERRDIPDDVLSRTSLFHFGYPPLMRRSYENGGTELGLLLRGAKAVGATTSLDMAYPDPSSSARHVDWRGVLQEVLPFVDVFVPSIEEMLLMLDRQGARDLVAEGSLSLESIPTNLISALGEELISMGVGIVCLKCGERGLYLRTSSEERLLEAGRAMPSDLSSWSGREMWSTVFEVDVVGTTGAGDATAAGFLYALLAGMSPSDAVTAACAVGASSIEAADATAGVGSWTQTQERLRHGWSRREETLGPGWQETSAAGVWVGSGDKSNSSATPR